MCFSFFSTPDMSPSLMAPCPWWICGDLFPLFHQNTHRLFHQAGEKKHSFLFSGRVWADAGREFTIIMDLGCSQREQRCKRFSFYVFCSVKKIFHILLHFPNKQPAEGLVLGALCFCQCAVYFFPFVINKDVRSSVRDARLVTQTFLAPSSHFGFCLKDKVPRMRT